MAQDLIKSRLSQKIMAINGETKGAMGLSLALHVAVLVLFIWGLPSFSSPKQLQENINVVEILTVADITNVKIAKPKAPKPNQDTIKPSAATPPKQAMAEPAPKIVPKVKLKPKIRQREIEPLPKAVVKEEEKKPEPEEKKEEPVEKKEEPVDAFASVLKSVEELEAKEQDEEPVENEFDKVEDFLTKASKESYQPGIPLSISEIDAVRQQIMRNWTVLGGARNAESIQVLLEITVARDGTVTSVEILNDSRYAGDLYFRAMADSAVRAVKKSSPLQNLPEEKYEGEKGWHRMELTFDPSEMLY